MKIDVFPHIVPQAVKDRTEAIGKKSRRPGPPCMYDLELRFRIMEGFPDYAQVLTLPVSTIDDVAEGPHALELAKFANDALAELCARHPDRFLGFGAAVPIMDMDAALRETERAVKDLGALGVEIGTNVHGIPMDDPRFEPFYAKMAELDETIWVHPTRPGSFADYSTESSTKYRLNVTFGWPYESAIFMSRMIFSEITLRYPKLRFITHHAGGIVPHLADRIVSQSHEPGPDGGASLAETWGGGDVIDHYKRFYGDTSLQGIASHTLACALAFYGPEHILFGTDMPFGVEGGLAFVRDGIRMVGEADVSAADRQKIFEGNSRRILGLRA